MLQDGTKIKGNNFQKNIEFMWGINYNIVRGFERSSYGRNWTSTVEGKNYIKVGFRVTRNGT